MILEMIFEIFPEYFPYPPELLFLFEAGFGMLMLFYIYSMAKSKKIKLMSKRRTLFLMIFIVAYSIAFTLFMITQNVPAFVFLILPIGVVFVILILYLTYYFGE